MDYTLGQISLFGFSFQMVGWATCEGQILSVAQNQALFSLIGFTYGGDGRTTFALPNLRGAEPNPNMRYYICTQGIYPQRQY